MTKHGKIYKSTLSQFDRAKFYSIDEAFEILKTMSGKKFDETVDVSVRLAVDPRKADQMVRGTVTLPKGTGKIAKVIVFAQGDKAEAAKMAGADEVGADELIDKVSKGWTDFDAAVATPDLMAKVGKLGRVLGPRNLMPNPKTGTVTQDVSKAVSDIKGGKIDFRIDKNSNLAFIVGKKSFNKEDLIINFRSAINEIVRLKPATVKGRYITKVAISSTMSPSIILDNTQF
ncbi:MAG: 50S ribosomal protein L1 [Bifidobacteriaceae bacterium]|jgi:large subunit ribosomal protein L1|nr:50S ribosomal protein L1 [Bifidobacteriaceae bacterium]